MVAMPNRWNKRYCSGCLCTVKNPCLSEAMVSTSNLCIKVKKQNDSHRACKMHAFRVSYSVFELDSYSIGCSQYFVIKFVKIEKEFCILFYLDFLF